MKRTYLSIILILIIVVGIGGYLYDHRKNSAPNTPAAQTSDEDGIRSMISAFGAALKNVALSAPKEDAAQQIKNNYAPFVSQDVLNYWEQNPIAAPGRLTSSPWPDRIEIISIDKRDDGGYEVQAKVIEITSNEVEHGGVANEYQIAMILRKLNGSWIITGFTKAIPQS